MSVEVTGSTVPRRQLGRHLRELRNQQRLTVRAAARRLEWSEAKMWRIETGQTSLRSLDVEAMCKVYGAPRSEEHTSELQSHVNLVCRLLLEKKKEDQSSIVISCH